MVEDPVITAQQINAAIKAFSVRIQTSEYRDDVVYRAMLDALTAAARVKDNAAHSQ